MANEDIDEAFKKYAIYRKRRHWHEISCSKGLWGVSGCDREQVEREARHYFIQYYEDGEYDGN